MKASITGIMAAAGLWLLLGTSCGAGTGDSAKARNRTETAVSITSNIRERSVPEGYAPDGTYLFAEKDGEQLFLDIYEPEQVSEGKPTLIYVFGGGFVGGARNEDRLMPFFSALNDSGYRVVAIDYRLGLKGKGKVGIGTVDNLDRAIHMAVEDLFDATAFMIENNAELGIDCSNLVLVGSSAGAITSLQAEYEICNGSRYASTLPQGFNYKGVVSLAGAVLSRDGALKYASEPCPMLLLHGTKDDVVNYGQTKFFKLGWYGSDKIASVCRKNGYSYGIYRFEDAKHEIANSGLVNLAVIDDFISTNVMESGHRTIDALVRDPRIEVSTLTLDELYGE